MVAPRARLDGFLRCLADWNRYQSGGYSVNNATATHETEMPATIQDVARAAGVGRGTVSRVLNGRPNVDPATRARVLEAIAALDFVPSAAARRLSLRRTQSIAVVTLHLTRPSVVERLRGIESALVDAALDMVVLNIETVERRNAILRDVPRPERFDGLILISVAPHDMELAQIRRSSLPVVLIDAHHRALPRVVCDDVGGGVMAANHLLERGHRRFGFIGDEPRPTLGVPSEPDAIPRRRARLARIRPRDPAGARRRGRAHP